MKHAPLFALALLTGCASTATAEPGFEGPVGLGQLAYVDGPRVRPLRVIEDSRCPVGAQCVWEGRVVLRAAVVTGRGSKEVDLILGVPVPVADGTLTLVSLEPGRTLAGPVPPEQLRFTFSFAGGF